LFKKSAGRKEAVGEGKNFNGDREHEKEVGQESMEEKKDV